MNDIQIFNNPVFGNLRTVIIAGKEFFFGVDVAEMLMYKRPRKAVTDNCKGVLNEDSIKNNGGYAEPLIPEGDVYRLIIKAGQQGNSPEIKEKADKLEKWIFDEVLPSIRKTGSYNAPPMTIPEQIQLLAKGNVEIHKRMDDMQSEITSIKLDLPILPIEADKITSAVRKKGIEILGGKESTAYNDRGLRQLLYNSIYANVKYNFNIKSYKSLKRCECDKAIEIINEYQPPFFLQQRINTENLQQKFDMPC